MAIEDPSNRLYIYPKDLLFTGGTWTRRLEGGVLVAELKDRKTFDIKGKFDTTKLAPGLAYRVEFDIEMKSDASGWEIPVKLKLEVPTMEPIKNSADLSAKHADPLLVGDFYSFAGMTGEMQITMSNTDANNSKKGLVVKKVIIRPA